MGRPPTQAEVDAIGDIVTKLIAANSLKPVCNISLAAFLAYRTRRVMGFPFWRPKFVLTNPNVFPSLQNPVFTGARAKRAWHTARFAAYYVVSHFIVVTGLSIYAQGMLMRRFSGDPRLRETFEEMKGQHEMESVIRMRQRRVRQLLARGTKEQLAAEMQSLKSGLEAVERDAEDPNSPLQAYTPEKREAVVRKLRLAYHELIMQVGERLNGGGGPLGPPRNVDAHEEAGRLSGLSGPSASGTSGTDWPADTVPSSGMGQSRSPQPPAEQGWAAGSKGTDSWGTDTGGSSGAGSFSSFNGGDDDASPVAPSARGASSPSGGSAWDRIRQQAQSGAQPRGSPPASSTEPPSPWGTSSSSWGGSGSDWPRGSEDQGQQDKEAAKSKAQKEFDELLERERRAGRSDSW